MASDLVIITPELNAGSGGVADHTRALLRCWRQSSDVTVLTTRSTKSKEDSGLEVKELAPNASSILEQLPASQGKVFVQYSAYGFNRFGYPRELIRALIAWRKRTGGRLVVMFHEIWTFWPFTNKNFVVQQFHRRALKHLLRCCDASFTTTASQAEHLRRLFDSRPIQVLPAGSNIRPTQSVSHPRQHGCAVIFGLQSSRIRALKNLRKNLAAIAAAKRITKIIAVGQGSDLDQANNERELLNSIGLVNGFEQLGSLSEEAVSDVLSGAAFGIFGQNELSCTKSGSFMAYAAHRLNVLADFAAPSKPPPICWLIAPAELLHGISEGELNQRAECLHLWQEQNASWDVIAARIAHALGLVLAEVKTATNPVTS